VNAKIRGLCFPLFVFLMGSSLQGANPDLALAPLPLLSGPAWNELERQVSDTKTVTLHAQIVASQGKISGVAIKEANHWPISSAEVESWIRQHWKFVRDFSGTVVQPITFRVLKAAAVPTPTPVRKERGASPGLASLEKSPKPVFPDRYKNELLQYEKMTHQKAGVLLVMTVRNGAIIDMRVTSQMGPTDFCEYTARWVREHWAFRSYVNGTFRLPVYYDYY
jgi:hypothetical protein